MAVPSQHRSDFGYNQMVVRRRTELEERGREVSYKDGCLPWARGGTWHQQQERAVNKGSQEGGWAAMAEKEKWELRSGMRLRRGRGSKENGGVGRGGM